MKELKQERRKEKKISPAQGLKLTAVSKRPGLGDVRPPLMTKQPPRKYRSTS